MHNFNKRTVSHPVLGKHPYLDLVDSFFDRDIAESCLEFVSVKKLKDDILQYDRDEFSVVWWHKNCRIARYSFAYKTLFLLPWRTRLIAGSDCFEEDRDDFYNVCSIQSLLFEHFSFIHFNEKTKRIKKK